MEKDAILVELYKAHLKSKDAFSDRAFTLNRFYLAIVLVLLVLGVMYLVENNPMLTIPISVVGVVVSLLWMFNQDAYDQQIKVKYSSILEKMEEQFPFQPLKNEYLAIQEQADKKKLFVFPETLKFFSIATFIIFLVMFFDAFVPILMTYFS